MVSLADLVGLLLLQHFQIRRVKSIRRLFALFFAMLVLLLLARLINVRQRLCDVRDWEFLSSMFDSPKLVSRGPLLSHGANSSCTIAWESYSHTSLHFTHPKQPGPTHSSASSIWLPHYIGLLQAPFGCAWNVYHVQLESCPRVVVFQICSASSSCLSFTFNVQQPDLSHEALFFIIGDSQRGQAIFEQHLAVLSNMRRQPNVLLHLGDTAQRAYIDGDWDQRFFGPLRRSNLMLPLLLVQGNHDFYTEANRSSGGVQTVSTGLVEGSIMVNPSLLSYQGVKLRLPTYYATSLAGVRWIVLDTNLRSTVQLQWLRDEFRSSAATSANFRVVCMHIPPWIEFWESESWGDCDPDSTCDKAYPLYVRTYILPVLLGGGVNVVLSGHQHNYQRGMHGGVVFITSGGGGGELDLNRVENHAVYTVTHLTHHHMILNASSHTLSFVVLKLDGSVIDEFNVRKNDLVKLDEK